MHRLTLILLSALAAISAGARTPASYNNMLKPGRVWFYDLYIDRHEVVDYKIILVAGDTVVNNREAVKLKVIYRNEDEMSYLAAYEEDQRVYAQLQPGGDFELLMDFNATKGDKIEGFTSGAPDGRTLTVTDDRMCTTFIDEYNYTDPLYIQHRALIVNDGTDSGQWLEGIGPTNEKMLVTSAPMEGARMMLHKCYDGYKCIYSR